MRLAGMAGTARQLEALRGLMKAAAKPLQAYVVPSGDAHQSEYISAYDGRRAYLSGFTGSTGTALVTPAEALLWTDGRYFLQAEEQLDTNWQLMKETVITTPSREEWLLANLPPRSNVGANPMLMSNSQWTTLETPLHKAGHTLVPVEGDLVDQVWNELDGDSRPQQPNNPIFALPANYTGRTVAEKLVDVRAKMNEKNAKLMVITALDEVAYMLNLRGSDIPFNPVFYAYVCVTVSPDRLILFTNESRVERSALEQLAQEKGEQSLEIKPYEDILTFIRESVVLGMAVVPRDSQYSVWVSHGSSHAVHLACSGKKADEPSVAADPGAPLLNVVTGITPLAEMKAIKNPVESKGMENCHIRDGVALARYFSWLEEELVVKGTNITEISGADELERLRSELPDFMGLSFSTISSSGPNGAIIHYKPEPETDRPLSTKELYLCDSGAQFRDGTTDVTRTMHFGTPTQAEIDNFTRVLKGQIALGRAIFPMKIKGTNLDSLARQALWQAGLDYAHGTGHGVGAFLNVHEGPMGIGTRPQPDDTGLQPAMFVSNEPGFYEDGKYGIRLEDIVQIVTLVPPGNLTDVPKPLPRGLVGNFNSRGALGFQTVTMSPIQAKMINVPMLTETEIDYIDDYHRKVWSTVSPLMQEPKMASALAWLQRNTQPLKK